MNQLHTYVELTPEFVARLGDLCEVPYKPDAISSACIQNGWELVPPEVWETEGDAFLRVQITDDGPPMIALWGAESIAGLPLTVIFQDDVTVEISEATWDEFDSLFFAARRLCERQFGRPNRDGTYASNWRPHQFHFAFFQRQCSTLAILQHHEGDGHLGNDASLDIRIISMVAEQIPLPLKTNLIF